MNLAVYASLNLAVYASLNFAVYASLNLAVYASRNTLFMSIFCCCNFTKQETTAHIVSSG